MPFAYLPANNQTLGSPVNRINILARHAADALVSTSVSNSILTVFFPRHHRGKGLSPSTHFGERFSQWFGSRLAFLRFRGTLLVLDIAFFSSTFLHWCSAVLTTNPLYTLGLAKPSKEAEKRKRGRGFEDDLEESMQRLAR